MTDTVSQETNQGALPSSWSWTTLSEIGAITSGGTPSTKEPSNFDGGIPWITPADLSGYKDKTIAQGRRNISQKGLDSSSARLLPQGTVLFSSRAPVGYVVIARNPISTNQGFKNLIPSKGVFNEYVYYYLKGSKSLAESYASGTTFLELSAKAFGRLPIPLAPLNEQRRIVEKIEELFTKLDAGVRSLEQARALLKSYRRSVLKAAVEGELSREWREEHRNELEPASELLERILQERREKFAGKKYKEPAAPDTSKLPALPDEWEWTLIGQVFDVFVGATPSRRDGSYWNGQIPWVSSGEVAFCRIKDTREKITELGLRNTSTILHPPGTVLLGMIGEGKTRGQAAILDIEACHNQNSAAIQVSSAGMSPEYVYYFLHYQYAETRRLGSGNNQPALNRSRVREMMFPLPPLAEQRIIVGEVERRLSVVDKLEATVEASLKQAGGLRQSILKRAFSGELVPQDPEDEPAGVLLERIRSERLNTKQKSKRGRGAKRDELQGRLI